MNGDKSTDKPLTTVLSLPTPRPHCPGLLGKLRVDEVRAPAPGHTTSKWQILVGRSLDVPEGRQGEGRRTGCGSGELPLKVTRPSGLPRRAVGGCCGGRGGSCEVWWGSAGPSHLPRPHSTPSRDAWPGAVASSCWSRDPGPGAHASPASPHAHAPGCPSAAHAASLPAQPPVPSPGRPWAAHHSSSTRGLVTPWLGLSLHSCEVGRIHHLRQG